MVHAIWTPRRIVSEAMSEGESQSIYSEGQEQRSTSGQHHVRLAYRKFGNQPWPS